MAQKEFHAERTEKSSLPNFMPTEFAELGKKRIEEFVNTQKELVEKAPRDEPSLVRSRPSGSKSCVRACIQIDGSAFHPGRDGDLPGVGQPAL